MEQINIKKESIFRQIIFIFIVTIFVVFMIVSAGSYFFSKRMTELKSREQVINVAELLKSLFSDIDIDYLKKNKESSIYKEAKTGLRKICQSFKFEYLYILIKNKEQDSYQYIVAAAYDDDNDKAASERVEKNPDIIINEKSDVYYRKNDYANAFNGLVSQNGVNINNKYGNVLTWFYPVFDKNKKVKYVIGIDYEVKQVTDTIINNTVVLSVPVAIASLILLLIVMSVLHRKVFNPIKIISQKMNNFIENKGKDSDPLKIASNNEIREISDSFYKMSDEIINYINDIERLTKDKVEADVQLEVAKKIQYGIVPNKFSEINEKYNACACAYSAKYIGGDFYDCFKLENGNVCIVIGDVSGKGISAALFMAMAKTVIRQLFIAGKQPAETLIFANNELCESNPEGMFVTVFAAILDINTGILTYANAGHNKPVILGDSIEFLNAKSGIVLGFLEDPEITEEKFQLYKNQGILLYTDGVTEAINNKDEFYGDKRLIAALQKLQTKYNSEEIIELVKKDVFDYYNGLELFDDLTLLALIYS